jgi:hypothetical protein
MPWIDAHIVGDVVIHVGRDLGLAVAMHESIMLNEQLLCGCMLDCQPDIFSSAALFWSPLHVVLVVFEYCAYASWLCMPL